jgi:hypothetical protein
VSPPRLRRRELVTGAALAAAGGLVLGNAAVASAQDSADLQAVLGAIALQQALAVAYDAFAARPGLGRDLRGLLGEMAHGERQHAAALLSLAEFLGARPQPEPTFAAVEAVLPKLRLVVDRPTALAVVDELERAELLGFAADVKTLGDAKLIQMVAAVGAGDAQHLALVRAADGRDPIPSALETGMTR